MEKGKKERIFTYLAALAVLLALPACRRERADFGLADFEQGRLDPVPLVSDFSGVLGNPSGLVSCGPDMLVLTEPMKEKQLLLLDLRQGTACESVSQGRGPGEILYAWALSQKNGQVFVYDAPGGKLLFPEIPGRDDGRGVEELRVPDGVMFPRLAGMREGYAALSPFGSGNRLTLLDEEMRTTSDIPFPDGYACDGFEPDNDMFQSLLGCSPASDRIVTACRAAPYVDIYTSSGALVRHLQGPNVFTASFKEEDRGGGRIRTQEPMYFVYAGLSVSDEAFMLGYDGSGYVDEKSRIGMLLLFDLDGKPLKRYDLPEPLSAFDVDWESRIVYGIPGEGAPRIVAYSF